MLLGRSFEDILLSIPGILIALVFNGFAQAYMADKLGDRTPRLNGKLSISPKEHVDPIGFIFFAIVGFGWSKPVDINRNNFKNIRIDDSLVTASGFIGNLLMSVLFAILIKLTNISNLIEILGSNIGNNLDTILRYVIWYNAIFFVLGILPIPPFSGSRILENLTDIDRFEFYATLKRYGFIVFMILAITPILSMIITPPTIFIYQSILKIFNIPII
ncbi:MAG: site-2 protease family protein [Bacillota bacterium]|nr:site-2 protease family protein [Bacillota bacterium]